MSMFNSVVEPHPLAPMLLRAINWGQPDDPEKKYPLIGRIYYVWMTDDLKQVKVLFREGESSWSDDRDAVVEQIKTHEGFVSLVESKDDSTFVIATFNMIRETSYNRYMPIDDIMERMDEAEEMSIEQGYASLKKDPFEIFNEKLDGLKIGGELTPKMKNILNSMSDMFEQAKVEDELSNIAKEAGVELKTSNIKVMMVKPDGKFEDRTDEFLNKDKTND